MCTLFKCGGELVSIEDSCMLLSRKIWGFSTENFKFLECRRSHNFIPCFRLILYILISF